MNYYYRYPYYRGNPPPSASIHHPAPPPQRPLPPKPAPKPNPKKPAKKKFCFKSLKNDTCSSLNDIEHFLCDFSTFIKYVKLYKLLK